MKIHTRFEFGNLPTKAVSLCIFQHSCCFEMSPWMCLLTALILLLDLLQRFKMPIFHGLHIPQICEDELHGDPRTHAHDNTIKPRMENKQTKECNPSHSLPDASPLTFFPPACLVSWSLPVTHLEHLAWVSHTVEACSRLYWSVCTCTCLKIYRVI